MTQSRSSLLGALFATALLAGCAKPDESCRRAVDALNARARRCDAMLVDDRSTWLALEAAVTLQRGCGAATSLRDPDGFERVCIPALEALACVGEAPLPAECEGQLRFDE